MKAGSAGSDRAARGPAPNGIIEGWADLRGLPGIVLRHRSVEVRPGTARGIAMSDAAIRSEAAAIAWIGPGIRTGSRLAPVGRPVEAGIAAGLAEPFTPESFDERVRP